MHLYLLCVMGAFSQYLVIFVACVRVVFVEDASHILGGGVLEHRVQILSPYVYEKESKCKANQKHRYLNELQYRLHIVT